MAGSSRRRILATLLVVGALLVVLVVWVWGARRDLAERALLDALAARGATPASLRVVEAGPGGLVIEDLRVGDPPDLRVARLEVALSPASAASARLASARAEGVVLRGRLGPDGLQLGAAQGLLGGDDAAPAPLALPARRVVLRDARAELATPAGPVTAEGSLEAREAPDGALHVEGAATLAHALGRVRAEAEAHGPPDALEATAAVEVRPSEAVPVALDTPWTLQVRGSWTPAALEATATSAPVDATARVAGHGLRARLPETTLRLAVPAEGAPHAELETGDGALRAPDLEAGAALERLDARVRADVLDGRAALTLRDLHEPARLRPVHAAVTLGGEPSAPLVEVTLAPPAGDPFARVQVRARRAETGWEVHADLLPVDLAAVDVARRAPALAARLGEALALSGELEGRLEARPADGDGPPLEVDLALRDVDLTAEPASFYGLRGRLRVAGPPWRTPGIQTLAMERVDLGLVLDEGTLRILLHPDGRLELREAAWRFAGGRVRVGADLGGAAGPHGVLTAEGIDVAALTDLLAVEGLEGTGTLAGALPVHVEGEALRVRDGVLHSVGDGTLRWRPPAREALAGRPGMGLLLDALEDFHYERIALDLDGDLRGTMDVGLHLRGRNPNLQGGRPVELNVNVDARLADLVRAGRASYRVPEIVEEHLRDFSTGRDR